MRMAVFWDSCIIIEVDYLQLPSGVMGFLVEKQKEKPYIYHQSALIEHSYCHTGSNRSHCVSFPARFLILYSL